MIISGINRVLTQSTVFARDAEERLMPFAYFLQENLKEVENGVKVLGKLLDRMSFYRRTGEQRKTHKKQKQSHLPVRSK